MDTQHLQTAYRALMKDPEWIALESIEERTRHFIFDDAMLQTLKRRGLVEPADGHWRVTRDGRKALSLRAI